MKYFCRPMKNTLNRYFLIGIAIITAYFIPALIAGENLYVCVHDFLDSTMAHIKMMKDTDTLFDYDATMPMMGGLPRFIYEASNNLKIWIYALVPPFWGVLLNYYLVRITAFAGLFLLLSRYVLPRSKEGGFACFAASLLFAFLPYYVDYGLSSAGIPLLAFAFLNIFNKKDILLSFVLIAYYAVNNSLVLGGAFSCAAAAFAVLWLWIDRKKFPWLPFAAVCFYAAVLLWSSWQMIWGYLTWPEEFSRSQYSLTEDHPLIRLMECLSVLLVCQPHASLFPAFAVVGLFIFVWKKYRTENPVLGTLMHLLIILASVITLFAVIKVAFSFIPFVRQFQSDRFFFLYPGLCFTLLGASFYELLRHGKRKTVKWCAVLLIITNLAADINFRENVGRITGITKSPSFKEFYDVKLFSQMKEELGIKECETTIACVGMHPSVAEYNGIKTMDGYIQMYPLSYKNKFYEVIAGELEKSEDLKDYFCHWGSRCYMFSAELGRRYMLRKDSGRRIENLDINCTALAALGCRYIFSSVEIGNADSLGLEYRGSWSNPDSWWEIRVYGVPGAN